MPDTHIDPATFVRWFRNSGPYINAFRGRTFVIAFGGELVAEQQFATFVHDLALLNSLGVRLVLVHGARPQIEERLRARAAEIRYVNGLRVTDDDALACVKEATGAVRVEVEALLSMGLANTPMSGADMQVVSGNFVTAHPLGIRDGVDYLHTGEVRRIDAAAVRGHLANGTIVLLSPLGYSPTGEVFNLSAEDVATAAAIALGADKLVCLIDGAGVMNGDGDLVRELTLPEADEVIGNRDGLPEDIAKALFSAVYACRSGVHRAHLVDRRVDGAILQELFTRDGIGTLISGDAFEGMRQATIEDVGGVLELIAPLEADGILVRRSRERLEMEIGHFTVLERDGMIIACAALYPFSEHGLGELACMAVHPDYRRQGRADSLLGFIERRAKQFGLKRLFVLTTRTSHWFRERGFVDGQIKELPVERQALYNYQRRSRVLLKNL